ncbi:MAG: OmpA family protein [Bacteroidetes bacterium]|nr:OmpA family protein [Bacteroidota bacterium]
MEFNVLETVKKYFSGELPNQVANSLDESGKNISTAMEMAIPTGLAAILHKVHSSEAGANLVYSQAKNAITHLDATPNVGHLQEFDEGDADIKNLLGNKENEIASVISKYSGISKISSEKIFSLILPATLGFLGKYAIQNNLSASGLSNYLKNEKNNILSAIPPEVSAMPGFFKFEGASPKVIATTHEVVTRKKQRTWVFPIILILAVLALLIWLSTRHSPEEGALSQVDTSKMTATDTSQNNTINSLPSKENIKVLLPNGKELNAYKGGIEDQLVTFLKSDWKSLSDDSLKNKWFDFDNLNFNTGNAIITPGSEPQLNNIAEILKAFPDAKIKIGGYTDISGTAADNMKLSQARANAARDALAKRGAGSQVVSAEGYGSQYATHAANEPDEVRALDRHVSVSVRKK